MAKTKTPKTRKPLQGKPKLRLVRDHDQYDPEERRYFRVLHSLIDKIYDEASSAHDWTWSQLATEANLAYQTVSKLGMRETRWPQFKTVYKLAKAVGWDIELIESKKEQKSASMKMKKKSAKKAA